MPRTSKVDVSTMKIWKKEGLFSSWYQAKFIEIDKWGNRVQRFRPLRFLK